MIAIPAVGAVLAGLMAVLFILAWAQFGNTIVRVLSVNLPIIGNVIGNAVAKDLEATYDILLPWFDKYVVPLANFVSRPVVAFATLISALTGSVENTYEGFARIQTIAIPRAIAAAEGFTTSIGAYILTQVTNADEAILSDLNVGLAIEHAYAVSVWTGAQSLVNLAIADGESYANYVYAQAIAQVNAAGTLALNFARSEAATVASYSLGLFNQLETYATAAFATAEADALHYYNQALTYADHAATTAAAAAIGGLYVDVEQTFAGALPDLRDDVDEVIDALGNTLPDILVDIQSIPLDIPVSIAGAIGLSIPLARTVATYLRECGVPNCNNLSQYGKDIQALFGLVGDAGFLAWIIEMVHDPEQGARDTQDVFGPIASAAVAGARDLLSI